MNPIPATSTDETKSTSGMCRRMAAATSAGLRLIPDPHRSATLVEKSPNRFCGGRVSSICSGGDSTPSSEAAFRAASWMSRRRRSSITAAEGSLARGRPPERAPHRIHQLGGIEWLGDVRGHAQSVALLTVLVLGSGRDHDHRDVRRGRIFEHGAPDLPPVDPGHHEVEQDQGGSGLADQVDGLATTRRRLRVEPLEPEVDLEELDDDGVVVDDEDDWGHLAHEMTACSKDARTIASRPVTEQIAWRPRSRGRAPERALLDSRCPPS